MIVPMLFLGWCLILLHAAIGYFLSGWIGRRMKPETSPLVPYGLTFLVLMGFLDVHGFGPALDTAITMAICAAGLGIAVLDRHRRRVSVFEHEGLRHSRPLPRAERPR